MSFEWDTDKQAKDVAKHGIDFIQAAQIFKGTVLERADARKNYGEERIIALGEYDGVVLCVVYTLHNETRRLISAWRASKNDRQKYKEACRQL